MLIRRATSDDVESVLPMVAKICAFHEKLDPAKYGFLPHPEERYRGWLANRTGDPRSVFLVAQPDSGAPLIGFLIATIEREIPIYRLDEFGFIHDLWVQPEFRKQGVGKALAESAVSRFGQLGVTQVRLDTAAANESARKLFAAVGFRPSVVEMLREI
ncbi:MAG TPA: GNAT family N-acetyltransferase [Tepidisphaeraceae bacterium]|jgi:ribosomal protein S18 acetylase RimI-like enzyme|nr:GNAT family N-acetyltransferase [Tepidisphaeraceae bacterium]